MQDGEILTALTSMAKGPHWTRMMLIRYFSLSFRITYYTMLALTINANSCLEVL